MNYRSLYNEDSIAALQRFPQNFVHLILSDIPYGIGAEDWDVLHSNMNSAYLGSSPAQERSGNVFKHRGKPLNGWSEADKLIPKQYYDWVMTWAKTWCDVLVPGGNVFVFAGRRLAHRCITAMEDSGFTFKDMLGWNKVLAPHRAQRISVVYERRGDLEAAQNWQGWRVGNLRPIFEPILWFTKPYPVGTTIADNVLHYGTGAYHQEILRYYQQDSSNLFTIQSAKTDTGLYPTQKPLKLMELLIELTTQPGQVVLDPFAGSATTLVAAMKLGRQFLGFEKDTDYYKTAQKRLTSCEDKLENSLFSTVAGTVY